MDALFSQSGILTKTLANGLKFEFIYRSKIARDFIMNAGPETDHVWEPQTTKLLVHLCRLGARQVAVGGAYFGDQAVFMANEIRNSGGQCHCFEPNTEQNKMLSRNFKINELENACINQAGLWSKNNIEIMLVGSDSHAYPKVVEPGDDTAGKETFPAMSLDGYGQENGIDNFDLIMLDIEGGELEALRGAEGYLNQPTGKAPNLVFEVHSSYVDWSNGLKETDLLKLLIGKGYHVFSVRDYQSHVAMAGQPIELIEPEETYLEGPPHGFNMLAVKDRSIIDNKAFRLCSNVSPKLLFHRDPKLHQPVSHD